MRLSLQWCIVITLIVTSHHISFAQIINQPANWPNTNWTIDGVYSVPDLLHNPLVDPNFGYDDDGAGSGSTDSVTAESPFIDLTSAVPSESNISVSVNYVFNELGVDLLVLEYWDADAGVWQSWHEYVENSTSSTSYETCSNLQTDQSPALNVSAFSASQLSSFKYRLRYEGSSVWGWGFCFGSPTLSSAASCTSPSFSSALDSADCGNGQYFVNVNVTGLGDGTPAITDGNTTWPVSMTGVQVVGPFTGAVNLTLLHGSAAACDVPIGSFTSPCPPSNDSCASAKLLSCDTTLTGEDATLASAVDAMPCSGNGIGEGLWYQLDGFDGSIDVTVIPALWDAEIQVWSGSCGALTCEARADGAGNGGTETISNLTVASGTTYYIYVGYWSTSGATGPFDISVTCSACIPPSFTTTVKDIDCSTSSMLSIDVNVSDAGSGSTVDITNNGGAAFVTNVGLGTYTIGPFPLGNIVRIYVADHADPTCVDSINVVLPANCPPPNDDCSGAIDLGTLTSPLSDSTDFAGNHYILDCLTNPGAPDMVYKIDVPNGATLNIQQTSNTYDSKHRLAWGGSCPGDSLIVCRDDPDTNPESWENNTGTTQTVYWVQSAFSSGRGNFTLAWEIIQCVSPTVVDPPAVDLSNCPASGDISVTITDLGDASSVDIISDAGINQHGITDTGTYTLTGFTAGTDVTITVKHDADSSCNVTLSIVNIACPPANDSCTQAIQVMCGDTLANQTTIGATGGSLTSCLGSIGAGVWYTYMGNDQNIQITVTPDPGSFNPQIDVYTSSNGMCDSLTCLDAVDDGLGNVAETITFTALSGVIYYINVGPWLNGDPGGTFTIDVQCVAGPVNDDLCNAYPLVVGDTAMTFTNVLATAEPNEPEGTCWGILGTFESVWFSFVAPASGLVLVTTDFVTQLTDTHIGVYSLSGSCSDLTNLTEVGCDEDGGEVQNLNSKAYVAGLTPSETYYIQVDGYSSAKGDFKIQVIDGCGYVMTTQDSVSGSLRQAVEECNMDTVTFIPELAGDTLQLGAPLNLSSDIAIVSEPADNIHFRSNSAKVIVVQGGSNTYLHGLNIISGTDVVGSALDIKNGGTAKIKEVNVFSNGTMTPVRNNGTLLPQGNNNISN